MKSRLLLVTTTMAINSATIITSLSVSSGSRYVSRWTQHQASSVSSVSIPRGGQQKILEKSTQKMLFSSFSSSNNDYTSSIYKESRNSSSSVTRPIYIMEAVGVVVVPNVTLFTKGGCTLCDKVKDVLECIRTDHPHSLYAVDITDDDKTHWFDKYKYDIPVLHMNGIYWAKHRLTIDDAISGLIEARNGQFTLRNGEPDASRLEQRNEVSKQKNPVCDRGDESKAQRKEG